MQTTRRQFLKTSISTGAIASLGLSVAASTQETPQAEKKLKILILGGTGFLGPALVRAILDRGHTLTLFNSGATEERREKAGLDSVVPEGVEELVGNRDPELTADDRRLRGDPDIEKKRDPKSPKGLSQLEGREWDAAIDTSGYFPRMVNASASLLAPNIGQYVFISTISVYKHNDIEWQDEDGELLELEDPTVEEFGPSFQNYGGGKVLCEQVSEEAMPGRATIIRPGFIVGPLDPSRRFTYWPWRAAQGGEMLLPGDPSDPMQLIDVRDLAEWTVYCIEQRTMGIFNATGPEKELTMKAMVEACREGTESEVEFTWADPEFLGGKGLNFPMYAPPSGDSAGFHRTNVSKACKAGLRFRSTAETARDTYAWYLGIPEEHRARVLPPDQLEAEATALAEWKARE